MARQWNTDDPNHIASEIAKRFDLFQCDSCAAAIARRLGKDAEATFERLRTSDSSDVIALAEEGVQISTNRVHVGVRIGDRIIDNVYPEGILDSEWICRFITATNAALVLQSRPIRHFFSKRGFQTRKFTRWLSG